MNQRPLGSIIVTLAIVGFVSHALTAGLTEHSAHSYEWTLT